MNQYPFGDCASYPSDLHLPFCCFHAGSRARFSAQELKQTVVLDLRLDLVRDGQLVLILGLPVAAHHVLEEDRRRLPDLQRNLLLREQPEHREHALRLPLRAREARLGCREGRGAGRQRFGTSVGGGGPW